MLECSIGVESVELLLCLDSGESTEKEGIASTCLVAWNVVGDVGDELSEKGNLEQLVEGNKSQAVQAVLADRRWWRRI